MKLCPTKANGARSGAALWSCLLLPALCLFFAFSSACWGADERAEVRRLAPKYGADPDKDIEVRQWDGTRVDILTPKFAIEVDWAKSGKHFEAIGQALYYAIVTDRRPGIILLRRGSDDDRFIHRTQAVCSRYGIRLWVEDVERPSVSDRGRGGSGPDVPGSYCIVESCAGEDSCKDGDVER